MVQRREAIKVVKEIYEFLKKNKSKEYSINKISKELRSKYEMTIKCLELLKFFNLVKERRGNNKPIPERLFSLKN